MIADLNTPCDDPRCGHLLFDHERGIEHGVCTVFGCPCNCFKSQPRQENAMHPELISPDEAPAQLYRVTLTLDIDVVSREGFSGAAHKAMEAARRAMDSTSDKATVVAVSVPCA